MLKFVVPNWKYENWKNKEKERFYVFTDISGTAKSVKSTRSIGLDIFARRKQTTSY